MHEPAEEARPQPAPHRSADRHAQPVDLEQLADRVYRLLLAELRLEQARRGRPERRMEKERWL